MIYRPYSKYAQEIFDKYRGLLPFWNTITIPFASFTAASAITNTIVMDEVTDDVMILGFTVDFSATRIEFLVKDNTQYAWCLNDVFTPLAAIAGFSTQVMPVLPMAIEFFLPRNNKIQWQFRNDETSPLTTDQQLTAVGIRLKDPIQ